METTTQPAENTQFNLSMFLQARKELRDQVAEAFTKVKNTKKYDRKDVIKMMSSLMELVTSLDNLSDIVVNDLMIVDKRFADLEQRIFSVGQGHTVLRQALADKAVITQEDLTQAWELKVKPELEAKIKEASEATKKLENLVSEPTGLVDMDGSPISSA